MYIYEIYIIHIYLYTYIYMYFVLTLFILKAPNYMLARTLTERVV